MVVINRLLAGVVALLALASVAAAVLFGRPSLAIAVVVAAVVVAVVSWVSRTRNWLVLGVISGVVALVGLIAAYGLLVGTKHPNGAIPAAEVTVAYRGTGLIGSDTVTVHEELTFTADTMTDLASAVRVTAVTPDQVTVPGWKLDHTLNGSPVFVRDSTVSLTASSLIKIKARIPVDLGYLTVRTGQLADPVTMVAADGSVLRLTGSKGAVAAVTPPPTGTETGAGGTEVTTVPVDEAEGPVTVDILKPILRNSFGAQVNDFFSWGFLPTIEGVVMTAAFGALRKRLADQAKKLGGKWWKRVKPGGTATSTPPADGSAPVGAAEVGAAEAGSAPVGATAAGVTSGGAG